MILLSSLVIIMNSKILTILLFVIAAFSVVISSETQAKKATMSNPTTEIIHKNDNGTYGVTNCKRKINPTLYT